MRYLPTAEGKTADTDSRRSAARCNNTERLERCEHVIPSGARADLHKAVVGIVLDGADVLQIDGYTVLNVGCASIWSVATTTNGKLAGLCQRRNAQSLDRERDFFRILRLNDAARCYRLLLDIKVRIKAGLEGRLAWIEKTGLQRAAS